MAASSTPLQFPLYLKALFNFAQTSPDRVPLSDWYDPATGRVIGFRARPVVGLQTGKPSAQMLRLHSRHGRLGLAPN